MQNKLTTTTTGKSIKISNLYFYGKKNGLLKKIIKIKKNLKN